jgi:hypothetical protein
MRYAISVIEIYPLEVEVEQKLRNCPGVQTKYSPPTVLAGICIPTPGMAVELTRVEEVLWSMETHPAKLEMIRICWVLAWKFVETTVGPPPAPPA